MIITRNRQQGNGMEKKILTLVSILLLISVSCTAGLTAVKADNDNITINYSFYTTTNYYTLLVVNMTIKDNGYSDFNCYYPYFTMSESGNQYPTTQLTALPGYVTLPDEELNNGDTVSGSLVFVNNASVNGAQYTLGYNNTSSTQSYNIILNGASTTSSSASPTPTPTAAPTSTTNSSPATPEFPTVAILAVFLGLSFFAVTVLTIRKRTKGKS